MARDNGRFTLMDAPRAFPFREIINNTPDGPVFDIGVDLDMFDGVVYIKAEHVGEMAEQMGFISPVEAFQLKERVKELEKEVEVLPKKIGKFSDELNDLVHRYYDDLHDRYDTTGNSVDAESDGEESEVSGKDTDGAFDAFGQIIGLDLFKGPNDIPADSSDAKRDSSAKSKG